MAWHSHAPTEFPHQHKPNKLALSLNPSLWLLSYVPRSIFLHTIFSSVFGNQHTAWNHYLSMYFTGDCQVILPECLGSECTARIFDLRSRKGSGYFCWLRGRHQGQARSREILFSCSFGWSSFWSFLKLFISEFWIRHLYLISADFSSLLLG